MARRRNVSPEQKRRSKAYGRMFSAFGAGLFLTITGLIGFEAKTGFSGEWTGAPILSQTGVGIVFLMLGVYYYRRLPGLTWTLQQAPPERRIRNVGAGRSAGAAPQGARRNRVNFPVSSGEN